jgi:hypothetical protein
MTIPANFVIRSRVGGRLEIKLIGFQPAAAMPRFGQKVFSIGLP